MNLPDQSDNSSTGSPPSRNPAFPTTHWSMIVQAGERDGEAARKALQALCSQYWYPVYAFVRRQGRDHHEAEDCTQNFITRLLATDSVARARPERGKFRSYLLTALRHFLANEWRKSQAEKRGGGAAIESLDLNEAERRFASEPADPNLTPEQSFDRNWARSMIEAATADMHREYHESGRGDLFDALAPVLLQDAEGHWMEQKAKSLGMRRDALNMALSRLRRRLGERLRAQVADTVRDSSEIDEELRYLIASCGSVGNASGGK